MDAIKKQASKLREQVARQQQTILKQLGKLGHEGVMFDEADTLQYQKLQDLYISTRSVKHFQKDIVRGLEEFVSTSKKQMELARNLAENCCKYGIENQDSASPIARIAAEVGTSRASMEDHREMVLGILGNQVCEPLSAMVHGAPLEDARHLARCYDRTRQEFEIQAAEVIRWQSKIRDASAESSAKLKRAEKRLRDLKSSMQALGREATAAMLSVEGQQQEATFQKLLTMVDAERSYHRNVVAILENLHSEIILEEQMEDSSMHSESPQRNSDDIEIVTSNRYNDWSNTYFIGKVIHSFDAEAYGELSLEVDDYVIVRQVTSNGWSEGECNGKAGWFPSAYVVKRNGASPEDGDNTEILQH